MNLIYQCWEGTLPPGAEYSRTLMVEYAGRIGAEYRCDINQRYHRASFRSLKYDCLRPIWDQEFHRFDKVLSVDMDIYPVDGLTENIFDEPIGDLGLSEEPGQPALRAIPAHHQITAVNDEVWASRFDVQFPRDGHGRLKVYNGGLIMLTKQGMAALRERTWTIDRYQNHVAGLPSFYGYDQNYIHAMAFVLGLDFTEIPVEWNRQVHRLKDGGTYDERTADTKFVHVQLGGADHNDAAWHHRIVNRLP
jgi:hypothetical protein